MERLRREFEPQGRKVFPISAVSGQGVKELLYYVYQLLQTLDPEPVIFEPDFEFGDLTPDLPYEVTRGDDAVFVVEGPLIEKMLGYTNLESEKGFAFFQRFLKERGVLDRLKEAGIEEGDTVRMYGFEFDYYE